jgi:HNH endonuclease
MSVPDALAVEVLAKCARHCCVCRRYRPLQLQVHHIIPVAEGGSDDLANLIPICVSCHSDVHTATRLTRRFKAEELRLHRDAVYKLVEDGRLPASSDTSPSFAQLAERVSREIRDHLDESHPAGLPHRSIELLLAAACESEPLRLSRNDDLVTLATGQRLFHIHVSAEQELPDAVDALVNSELMSRVGDVLEITPLGQTMVDDLVSSDVRFTEVKVECLACGLHFILCTWYPERHSAATIACPECGNTGTGFMITRQQEFGFIFERVPGTAIGTPEFSGFPDRADSAKA